MLGQLQRTCAAKAPHRDGVSIHNVLCPEADIMRHTQRFTPAALPIPGAMYLTLSALGSGAGAESAHELLAEVLGTRLTRAQARCPMPGVTLSRHRGAMALIALFLARSLALAFIFEE